MKAVLETHGVLARVDACSALGLARATYYRSQAPVSSPTPASANETRPRKASPRALSDAERRVVLDLVHEARFVDLAVPQVYATLLDEGRYVCSAPSLARSDRWPPSMGRSQCSAGVPVLRDPARIRYFV